MTTQIEAKEMVDLRKRMLVKVTNDIKFVEQVLIDIKEHESIIRLSYHDALREYDSFTRPGRRFR